jgi:hypothetical protein
MAELKEKIKKLWEALTLPDGVDEEYDRQCDEAFLKFLDKVVIFSWMFFGVVASISIYFLITREIL